MFGAAFAPCRIAYASRASKGAQSASDMILEAWASGLIEIARLRGTPKPQDSWAPGKKLRLLIAGYNGARNTGEETRVEEIVRQLRRILGEQNVSLAVLTLNPEFSRGYYGGAVQVRLPFVFPPFLYREVGRYDGVVASCGAMFMSKFSSVPSIMMIEALGIAAAQEKLSIAYGGEAGKMDRLLAEMCRRYCTQTSMMVRNDESRATLQELGIPSEVGADTAWTFEPLGAEFGEKMLRLAGWDGVQPVLATCPNNPFWWPVRPSLLKAGVHAVTHAYAESHYQSIYFHESGAKARQAYQHYVAALAGAIEVFRKKRRVFPILIGMERLDAGPCQRISERLGGIPIFTSEQFNAFELVSVLRRCRWIVSSRYHALVTSMPGLVPSAGVTMDQRIRNLMCERGHSALVLEADDPQLQPKLSEALDRLAENREAICDAIGRSVVQNLKAMARMGGYFEQEVRRCFPNFPGFDKRRGWEDYLPPLGRELRSLVEKYESGSGATPSAS
jgi:polysaccharide pyruvyl transferase WcaK-like protein